MSRSASASLFGRCAFALLALAGVATAQTPSASTPPKATGTPALPKVTFTAVHVDEPYIAITFDDGPQPIQTPRLLEMLAKRKIKATFFAVGQCVKEYPAVAKRVTAEGHEIANHSWSHPNLGKMSESGVRTQLQSTHDAIIAATGVTPTLFRPPYGSFTESQRRWANKEFGYKTILWDVDPFDWKRPGSGVIASRILNLTKPGSIILVHDIHKQTVDAMPETLDGLLAKGFKFVTVSELLAMDRPRPKTAPKTIPKALPVTPAPSATAAPSPASTVPVAPAAPAPAAP